MNNDINVLVVDDNPEILFATSRIVKSAGYGVSTASTGAECMKSARENRPDLILLDVVLPDADGIELCTRIKADSFFSGTFVVLLSGMKSSSAEQAQGLNAGADGYIARPVSNQELKARLNAMVRILVAERERDQLIVMHKLAEEEARSALKEKEVLLRELYHRTKNNMQVIMSMLDLQAMSIKDDSVAQIFKESINRIKSMALVQERLYQTENLSRIDLKAYFRDLANHLVDSYNPGLNIMITTDMDTVWGTVEMAIPCGLIVNELVSNAFKHAFPGDRRGEIRICLKQRDNNMVEIRIGDDGVGLPEGFDYRTTSSYGLMSALGLAEHQLRGTFSVDSVKGVEFRILFKALPAKV